MARPGDQPSTPSAECEEQVNFVSAFSSDDDVTTHPSPCERVADVFVPSHDTSDVKAVQRCDHTLDLIAGKADPPPVNDQNRMRTPLAVTTDSHDRLIVADPGDQALHIFDGHKSHLRITAHLHTPIAVAVDAKDNLYVNDTEAGVIIVLNAKGKFERSIGNYKGGEKLFTRATGMAIDRERGRMYVADTPRHLVLVLDLRGHVLGRVGVRDGGDAAGQFRGPTDVVFRNNELFVLDVLNERVQVFDFHGKFLREIKIQRDTQLLIRPSGLAVDSTGRVYLTDSSASSVGVFTHDGQPAYRIGQFGDEFGRFKQPAGIWVDQEDRLYVADSDNRRVQVFQSEKSPNRRGNKSFVTQLFSHPVQIRPKLVCDHN